MHASSDRADGSAPREHEHLSIGQMVLANRPWRLVRDLSKVLVATMASAGFFIINSNNWSISDQLGTGSLVLIMVLAVGGLGLWLTIAHALWERPSEAREPALVKRANVATGLTLLIGLLLGYVVLFLAVLAVMALAVPKAFVASTLGHGVAAGEYLTAAWLAASMATVVGAIGSGLESDGEVRETINRYRPKVPRAGRP
jgi:hypothetical protein